MHIIILSSIVLVLLLLHWIATANSRLWLDSRDGDADERTLMESFRHQFSRQDPEIEDWPGLHLAKPIPWTPWQQSMLLGKTKLPAQLWEIGLEKES